MDQGKQWSVAHPTNTPTQLALSSDHPLLRGANAYPEMPAEWVHRETGERKPITEAWRAMSPEEWETAQKTGVIHSDERHNLFPGHEGTNASPTIETAKGYLKHDLKGRGILVRMQVHPDEKWFASTDGNVRTRHPIPLARVLSADQFKDLRTP